MPHHPDSGVQPHAVAPYVLLAGALFALIQAFALLSPILLSLLLTLLISLAVNPVISRLRALTGGREGATGLVTLTLVGVMGLTGWAFFMPMKASVTRFAEQLPGYWERLQKPLIKMEQQAVESEQKLQAEVTTEMAEEKSAAGEPEPAPPSSPRPSIPRSCGLMTAWGGRKRGSLRHRELAGVSLSSTARTEIRILVRSSTHEAR